MLESSLSPRLGRKFEKWASSGQTWARPAGGGIPVKYCPYITPQIYHLPTITRQIYHFLDIPLVKYVYVPSNIICHTIEYFDKNMTSTPLAYLASYLAVIRKGFPPGKKNLDNNF